MVQALLVNRSLRYDLAGLRILSHDFRSPHAAMPGNVSDHWWLRLR